MVTTVASIRIVKGVSRRNSSASPCSLWAVGFAGKCGGANDGILRESGPEAPCQTPREEASFKFQFFASDVGAVDASKATANHTRAPFGTTEYLRQLTRQSDVWAPQKRSRDLQ